MLWTFKGATISCTTPWAAGTSAEAHLAPGTSRTFTRLRWKHQCCATNVNIAQRTLLTYPEVFLYLTLAQGDSMAVDGRASPGNRLQSSCARPLCSSNHVPSGGKWKIGYLHRTQASCWCCSVNLGNSLCTKRWDWQIAVFGFYRQSNPLEGFIDDRNVTKIYGVLGTFTSGWSFPNMAIGWNHRLMTKRHWEGGMLSSFQV